MFRGKLEANEHTKVRLNMQIRKRPVLMAAIVAIVSTILIIGTVSAFVYIKHTGELPITVHRSNTSSTPAATATQASRSPAPLPDGDDWTQYRFDVKGTGMNPEGRISKKNVSQLTRQWSVMPNRAFGSTPAVVNGQVYVTNGNAIFDIDLQSGETVWRFDDTPQPHGAITSSVAVDPATHIAYYGTPDARVYAVNTLTGEEVWDLQIGNDKDGAFIWSSPLLVNGKVYIGLASHDDNPCVRGGVFAFNAATGNVVWKHYTAVPFDDCDCDFGEGAVDFVYHGQEYVVAGNKNGTIYALAPSKGNHSVRLAWSLKIAKSGFLNYGGIFQPPTYSNGTIFVAGGPTPDGLCKHGMLYALQASTGAIRWSTCTPVQVVSPISTTGDVLFVETGSTLLAYSSATGQELWRVQQSGEFWGGVSISRGSVLVASVSGTLYCYGFTGTT